MKACEEYRGLLMGLIDNELTAEEARDVNDHLVRCARCRDDYERLRETSAKVEAVAFLEPEDEVLEKLWKSPYSHLLRQSGLVLLVSGWIALILYSIYEFFGSDEPAFDKIAIAAIVLGFVVLLLSVIRERVKTYKVDPYKEVKR